MMEEVMRPREFYVTFNVELSFNLRIVDYVDNYFDERWDLFLSNIMGTPLEYTWYIKIVYIK